MADLIHIAYASAAAPGFDDAAIRELLDRTRKKNADAGITGVLLHVERSFFQILEGTPEVLTPLYEKLQIDRRHTNISKLVEEPISRREFGGWSMGLAQVTAREISEQAGLNDFFRAGSSLHELHDGNARKLMSAFKEGRFRSRVVG